jgi:hypothetical protein
MLKTPSISYLIENNLHSPFWLPNAAAHTAMEELAETTRSWDFWHDEAIKFSLENQKLYMKIKELESDIESYQRTIKTFNKEASG